MKSKPISRYVFAILLAVAFGGEGRLRADLVSDPPGPWRATLVPVADADISGAEPLMQQAIRTARSEVAGLLEAHESQPAARGSDALAAAYGRLGALLLLVEVEAQADACLRNAMTLQPDEFRWPYYAGYLAMLAGNLDRAVDYLEKARSINPDYPTLYVRLGKVRLDHSDLAEARAALEHVRDAPELASPANYYLGQIALLERRFDDAVTLLQAALAANPDATEVHYPLAQAYRALGDAEQARAQLALFKLRAPDIADPLLDELQAATKRSLPSFKRAIEAVRHGDYATAVHEFAAGLEVDPNNAAARISYARVLYLTGQTDAAVEELNRALASDPKQILGNFLQGVLRQQQGDLDGAAAAYRRTLELDPKHSGALFYLANLDFAAGRYAQAAEAYRAVVANDPSIAPARLLALVAARRAGTEESQIAADLKSLVDVYPDDPQARYALAALLAAADDPSVRNPDRGLKIAADLFVQQPTPPNQHLLALTQAAAGKFDQAIKTQQQLLEMAKWMAPPAEVERFETELGTYQRHEPPRVAWADDDPLFAPPPFDVMRPFRDYPATTPY
jgi:tetratricopeptide (TPR) repeat protein